MSYAFKPAAQMQGILTCASGELVVDTKGRYEARDITHEVQAFVAESGVDAGTALVQSFHTTAGLLLNENETGLRHDFASLADSLVPSEHEYVHDDMTVRWENICPADFDCPNGHAHLQQALFGAPSIVLAVQRGELVLGTWQRLMLVEYDRPRERRITLQAVGAAASGNGHRPTELPIEVRAVT
jgi:secondary thiamine-phosphate synthase enzyme